MALPVMAWRCGSEMLGALVEGCMDVGKGAAVLNPKRRSLSSGLGCVHN